MDTNPDEVVSMKSYHDEMIS